MYVGRFAPSPTGPLHFGSLVAAVASYCDAQAHHGKWLLRIENVDTTREIKGAATQIIETINAYGMHWDDDIIYQNERTAIYSQYFNQLIQKQCLYPCTCSRKEIADSSANIGIEGIIYPGTCRHQPIKSNLPTAWRICTESTTIAFQDRLAGHIAHSLSTTFGDFVIKRADQLFSYQLAVVVDDAEQNITHVVRGADLLNSTTRQIYLQQQLNLSTPIYAHIPIVKDAQGNKLSKQTLAPAIHTHEMTDTLYQALTFLDLNPPSSLKNASLDNVWDWAIGAWRSKYLSATT